MRKPSHFMLFHNRENCNRRVESLRHNSAVLPGMDAWG